MTTTVRRRAATLVLALSLLGGAALAANTALLSPTADGGLPGPIFPGPTKPFPTKPIPFPSTTLPPIDLAR